MNMQLPRNVRNQAGFTLIELIVVIVILGILAATALPKFADLGGDARFAALRAAKGSIESVAAMAHSKALITGLPAADVTMEGLTVKMANGYPTGVSGLATAAGLNATDWTIADTGGTLTIKPLGLATGKANCYFSYTSAATGAVPVTDLKGSSTDC